MAVARTEDDWQAMKSVGQARRSLAHEPTLGVLEEGDLEKNGMTRRLSAANQQCPRLSLYGVENALHGYQRPTSWSWPKHSHNPCNGGAEE
jgi:hypothetical protein